MSIQILNLDDRTKADMRNYAMVAGFVILMLWSALCAMYYLDNKTITPENSLALILPIMVALLAVGIVLAILGKRDLTAILFIMMALSGIMVALSQGSLITLPMDVALLFFGIIAIMTKDEQKWAIGCIMIINGMCTVAMTVTSYEVIAAISVVQGLIDFYIALCIVSERFKLPFRDVFTADEADSSNDGTPVDFKTSSSVMGFLLLMGVNISFALAYMIPDTVTLPIALQYCSLLGLDMAIAGCIMLVVAGMRYTPFLFVMIGVGFFVEGIVPAAGPLVGALYLILALFTMVRRDRRILTSVILLLTGAVVVMNNLTGFAYPDVALAIEFLLIIVSAYVVAALTLNGKLKLI